MDTDAVGKEAEDRIDNGYDEVWRPEFQPNGKASVYILMPSKTSLSSEYSRLPFSLSSFHTCPSKDDGC